VETKVPWDGAKVNDLQRSTPLGSVGALTVTEGAHTLPKFNLAALAILSTIDLCAIFLILMSQFLCHFRLLE
jgi:hypothetical protein